MRDVAAQASYKREDREINKGNALPGLGREFGEMLTPDPANSIGFVVLIFSKPYFAFLANDIENLLTKAVSTHTTDMEKHGKVRTSPAT